MIPALHLIRLMTNRYESNFNNIFYGNDPTEYPIQSYKGNNYRISHTGFFTALFDQT